MSEEVIAEPTGTGTIDDPYSGEIRADPWTGWSQYKDSYITVGTHISMTFNDGVVGKYYDVSDESLGIRGGDNGIYGTVTGVGDLIVYSGNDETSSLTPMFTLHFVDVPTETLEFLSSPNEGRIEFAGATS